MGCWRAMEIPSQPIRDFMTPLPTTVDMETPLLEASKLPATESAHAIKGAIDEAKRCAREESAECILFNLSGHGHFDLTAYQRYLAGDLLDAELPEAELARQLDELPESAAIDS